jgi:hypothetical protein
MECKKFVYKTLDTDIDEIRLIALQPSPDPAAAIACKLLAARLSVRPEYEALSYMWGSKSDSRNIEIQGRECQVTHNLWLALIRLRHPTEERII